MLTSNSEKRKDRCHTPLPRSRGRTPTARALKGKGHPGGPGGFCAHDPQRSPPASGGTSEGSKGIRLLSLEPQGVSFSSTPSSSSGLTRQNLLESFLLTHTFAFFFF